MRFMLCSYTYFILLFLFALAVPSSSSVGGNKNAEIEIDRLQRSTFRETENPSSDYRESDIRLIRNDASKLYFQPITRSERNTKDNRDGDDLSDYYYNNKTIEKEHQPSYRINNKPSKGNLRRRNHEFSTRIIGGGEAALNRYPYIASVTYERAHVCGGSLIADDLILSAAHCHENFDGVDIGRHNVKNPDEIFERYNVEKFITHPNYVDKNKPGVAFDNDFMIIKLYGWSQISPTVLNDKTYVPQNNQQVYVMGWGVADNVNKLPSDVLKQVSVNALSNAECKSRSGLLGSQLVSFNGRITNNMLCAQALNADACQGDSGGPLIVRGLVAEQDVQIGVVSWGLGCANPTFPGVYSRVTSASDWINKMVCEWAEKPPESFGCNKDTPVDDPNVEKYPVTVDIMLDRFPKETGWLIRSQATGKSVFYIAIGKYKSVTDSEKHIVVKVDLKVNESYEFIMLDSYGDGLKFDGGEYKLWLGDTPYMGPLLVSGSTFAKAIHHPFYVSKPAPVPTPTISFPTPSIINPKPTPVNNQPTPPVPAPLALPVYIPQPTASPTESSLPLITIAIKLDNFPLEIGWAISSDQNVLIASKPIGYYKDPNKLIIEKVRVPEEYSTDNVIFALLDDGQDGLCCGKGQGLFQIFVGDISPENLVAKGSKFTRLQYLEIDLQRSAQGNGKATPATPRPFPVHVVQPTPTPVAAPTKPTKKAKNAARATSLNSLLIFLSLCITIVTAIV